MKQLTSKANPGDLFYIPAINKENGSGIVVGRYISSVEHNVGYLIEVFDAFYSTPPSSVEAAQLSKRLFRPILCSFRFSEIPRWKILFSDPNYNRSQSDYDDIRIAFYREIWKGGHLKPASRDEMVGLEDSTCWRMLHIIFRVNAHLAGFFGPDECYNYHRLPKDERIDSPGALAKVIELANAIDNQSKNWFNAKKTRAQ